MKQVTIDTVRERMNEIEMWRGANNLSVSLKEEFELACLRQLLACLEVKPGLWEINIPGEGTYYSPHGPRDFETVAQLWYASPQPAPVVRDEHLLQSLETRINSLEIGERKGALSTQQATSLKAYRLAVQCLRSSATSDENATDNTAQQFEALATSAESGKP